MNKGTITRVATTYARGNIYAAGLNFYYDVENVFGSVAEGDLVEFDPVPSKAFKAINVRKADASRDSGGNGFPIETPSQYSVLRRCR